MVVVAAMSLSTCHRVLVGCSRSAEVDMVPDTQGDRQQSSQHSGARTGAVVGGEQQASHNRLAHSAMEKRHTCRAEEVDFLARVVVEAVVELGEVQNYQLVGSYDLVDRAADRKETG